MLKLNREILIFKTAFKIKTSSIKIIEFNPIKFKKNKIKTPMQHRSEYLDYGDPTEWKDAGFNYRLNSVDVIYYALKGNIVVGHLGLDSNEVIRAVYVDPQERRQGISEKLHLEVFKAYPRILSDDSNAMEPEEKKLWDKLMAEMPNNIKKLKDGSFIYET